MTVLESLCAILGQQQPRGKPGWLILTPEPSGVQAHGQTSSDLPSMCQLVYPS